MIEADNSPLQATMPGYDSGKSTATVFAQPKQTSSEIREIPASKTSPHLIYAGAGLIAVFAIGLIVVLGGLVWLNASNRTAQNLVQPTNEQNVSKVVTKNTPAPAVLSPKVTTPRGELQNTGYGPFYKNYDNSLETGVAYKYANNPAVYVYDGQYLRSIENERAYLEFYHCRNTSRIIDCAPIYEMPSIVTSSMFRGGSPQSGKTNVPTVRQMQDDIEKEVKKMVDEANR